MLVSGTLVNLTFSTTNKGIREQLRTCTSLYRQSLDNVTVVMIAFQSFKRTVFGKSKHSERSPLKTFDSISHSNNNNSSANTIGQGENKMN
jgi:hypothetical protein